MTSTPTQEETLRLLLPARQGDQEALTALVRLHLPLVRSLLRRFAGRGKDMEELYQQGCLGLVKAIRRFEPQRQVCFSTYAVPVILGEISRFFRGGTALHVPRGDRELQGRVERLRQRLRGSLGREPAIGEIAQALRMEPAELVLLMETAQTPASLEAPRGEDGVCLRDLLPDPGAQRWQERLFLKDMIQRLPLTERKLLYLRYQRGQTQARTAAALSMTQSQVSRLEAKIRLTLKNTWRGA